MSRELLFTDSAFPEKGGEGSVNERIDGILDYLYMLREQLSYSLKHIDGDNFSEGGIKELSHLISEPLYGEIENAGRDILRLRAEADSFSARLESAEGRTAALSASLDEESALIRAIVRGNAAEGYSANGELILAAVNGQSSALLSADKIDFSALSIMISSDASGAYIALGGEGMMISSEYFSVSSLGRVSCSDMNIEGGSINIGREGENSVFCVSPEGKVQTRGQLGLVGNGSAELTFMNGSSSVVGSLSYCYRSEDGNYALYLRSAGGNPLKLHSSGAMSLDCTEGLYIGTADAASVDIGRAGATLRLVGEVYVNGVRI